MISYVLRRKYLYNTNSMCVWSWISFKEFYPLVIKIWACILRVAVLPYVTLPSCRSGRHNVCITRLSCCQTTWLALHYFLCAAIYIIHVRAYTYAWWRHPMETFSALLAICAGISPVTGEFPAQRPVTRNFDVFFDLRPNKPLSNHEAGDLIHHRAYYDVIVMEMTQIAQSFGNHQLDAVDGPEDCRTMSGT